MLTHADLWRQIASLRHNELNQRRCELLISFQYLNKIAGILQFFMCMYFFFRYTASIATGISLYFLPKFALIGNKEIVWRKTRDNDLLVTILTKDRN